jgi:hypothetical protein
MMISSNVAEYFADRVISFTLMDGMRKANGAYAVLAVQIKQLANFTHGGPFPLSLWVFFALEGADD